MSLYDCFLDDTKVFCPGWLEGYHDPTCANYNPGRSILKALIKSFDDEFPHIVKKEVVAGVVPDPDGWLAGFGSLYELTLTTTKDDPYELRQFLNKIVTSPIFDVGKWRACMELTKAGLPHIHAAIWSRKAYVDGSKVRTYKPISFPYRYEMKKVRNAQNYLNYIEKEKNSPNIQIYCEEKGIPQFWNSNDGIPQAEETRQEVQEI